MIHKSIKKRLSISVALASFVPLILFAFIIAYMVYEHQKKQLKLLQSEKALSTVLQIKEYFLDVKRDVNFLLNISNFRFSDEQSQKEQLFGMIGRAHQYERFSLLTPKGKELFYVDRIEPYFEEKPTKLNQKLIQQALYNDKDFFGEVYFDSANQEPLIDAVFLVHDLKTLKVKQLLYAQLRFKKVWSIIAAAKHLNKEEIMVVNQKSQIVAHQNPSFVISKTAAKHVLQEGHLRNRFGEFVLRHKQTFFIGNQTFVLLVQQTIKEAYKVSLQTLSIALIILLGFFVFITFIMRYIQKSIINPVLELTEASKALLEGDFSKVIRVRREDELGKLSEYFNAMTRKLNSSLKNLQAEIMQRRSAQTDLLKSQNALQELNANLELKVEQKTKDLQDINEELSQSLHSLQQAQEQLIYTEKMASLGNMVAGVAHEINTPLGTTLTAVTHLQEESKKIQKLFHLGEITEEDLNTFLEDANQVCESSTLSLHKAAELIRSFKLVAVDQSSEEERVFELKSYCEDVFKSLGVELRRHKVRYEVTGDSLNIQSFPGAFSQIISNLIMNALTHAFKKSTEAKLSLHVSHEDNNVTLHFHDNGSGIKPEHLEKIYEPFFTTNRAQGSSGLGLHIVYNLVYKSLKGELSCQSTEGLGSSFIISFKHS